MINQAVLKKLSLFLILGLFLGASFSAYSQGLRAGARLVDALTNETQILGVLTRAGIDDGPARSVQDSLKLSWRALTNSESTPSPSELQAIIRGLNLNDPSDIQIRNQLQSVLNRPADQIGQNEIMTAVNNLIYLANRHGRGNAMIMACSSCVNSSLSQSGLRFTLQSVEDSTTQNILQSVLPSNPQALRSFISTRMRQMGLGDYSRVPVNMVSPEEERTLGLFLAMGEHGTAKQKELVNAVVEFSRTSNGQTNLLNPRNPHRFWTLFSEEMNEQSMDNWSRMLRQIASETNDEAQREEAFYVYLTRQAGDNPQAQEYAQTLRSQRCFFR